MCQMSLYTEFQLWLTMTFEEFSAVKGNGDCHVKHCCVARYGPVIFNGLFSATCAIWMNKLGVVVYGYC